MFERLKEKGGSRVSDFTDFDQTRGTYVWAIVAGVTVNVVSWIIALLTPEAVGEWVGIVTELSTKANAVLLAFPFWSTFVAAYSILRIPNCSSSISTVGDGEFMSSFRDSEKSNYVRNRILVALGVAAFNTIALMGAVISFR